MHDLIVEWFDTWQSTNDWIKALAIVAPLAFILIWRALSLHHARALAALSARAPVIEPDIIPLYDDPHLNRVATNPTVTNFERAYWKDLEDQGRER